MTTLGQRDRRPEALGSLSVLPDETICALLEYLAPRDIANLACVSSVMYILCNEEPLWMSLCLRRAKGPLEYKGSWKKTTLHLEGVAQENDAYRKPFHFDGFMSLYLYKRFYRCNTSLDGFSFDDGNVERRRDISLDEFSKEYDAKKPVLLSGLADSWPASNTWTIDQLSEKYGEVPFRISQRSPNKISMKFKDYISYMKTQRDEDPLYVFDDKFGEAAPELLKDYSVPHLFQEDWFEILDKESRPPYRWLIVGPERSGASWHVDPALTSAWNTLLCGRKRWALYPPGKVPLGVTVHVNEDDGDVSIDTPSSLQWWLDYYPLLADEDKPIECTLLAGETIYVPSGWWHCILNLEPTVAVTQNFVNKENFGFVCLDMAPGYHHKGVCRAGLLALDDENSEDLENETHDEDDNTLSYSDLTRKEKRIRMNGGGETENQEEDANAVSKRYNMWKNGFSYNIDFLASFLDKERDHYNFPWSMGNSVGQREMRAWLSKLWVLKPEMRELIWKGACIALNAEKWLRCLEEVCTFHNLPFVTEDEKLPVGTGSNPVYLLSDYAIKLFVEGGLEQSMYGLGTELEFYDILGRADSPLKTHIPEVLESGILFFEKGSYKVVPWDGKRIPDIISSSNFDFDASMLNSEFPFGIWNKTLREHRNQGKPAPDSFGSLSSHVWPYIITKRCKGKIFAQLRDDLTWNDAQTLASFLGQQLRNLHLLPYPPVTRPELLNVNGVHEELNIPAEWKVFVDALCQKKKDVSSRLENWGNPIPRALMTKIDEYIPDDFFVDLLHVFKDTNDGDEIKPCTWIHSDVMDDNIHMEPFADDSVDGQHNSWRPSHILDFSDLSIGDPICDLIPIYLDVFRGDADLFKKLLESYGLPLIRSRSAENGTTKTTDSTRKKVLCPSYRTMCYCILHEENVLGAMFSIWDELRTAESWEQVEQTVWSLLNTY
ncbi:F-box-like domain superfamily [Arabidopsis thaliana x Arabidopsis arenosa]|uniref:F-box-like domain superfamily n=1 Tax=Arabidopsis thaliana x Arabidopsis arenosa TaxID=1240361 RepID=A0A8T2BM56_9BRAS|nr:F-box-like domain superfamily [Arabidopsis thaliana x Arabidopsis arenosa]